MLRRKGVMQRAQTSVAILAGTFLVGAAAGVAGQQPKPIVLHSAGNPILSDGSYYSADPSAIVVGDTLYILAGRDAAPPDVNDFIMPGWELFATKNVASKEWKFYPKFLKPEQIFAWATPGRAYAGQIVQGVDKRFYLYTPVEELNSKNRDPFAIGVAVADSVLGPWKDAHPAGPIVSQSVPEPNHIQNIDPTVLVDRDGHVYMYWGTFGRLRGIELEPDMVTPKGHEFSVTTLTGFFEASRIFRRKDSYYLLYADNQAGPQSPCTEAVYHACIAYGTAPTPLGPWTYRGVILDVVSSTTSHPGIAEFKGQWYLAYHTADAQGGSHFRRSVSIDRLDWDDSISPARILKVKQTHEPQPPPAPDRNVANAAHATASNEPVPVQYWIKALNDGIVRTNPLPPDMWASWMPHNPSSQWIEYKWAKPVTLSESRILFWADHPGGADEGVAPPAAWHLEYWSGGAWHPVVTHGEYPTPTDSYADITFDPIQTQCLRAVFNASGEGAKYAGVAVQEWKALEPVAVAPTALRALTPSASDATGCGVADPGVDSR
jgi:Glycosyl hydrolases family 43